jgi:hypothetical protein
VTGNAARAPDNVLVAQKHGVECLHCGSVRVVERERTARLEPGECPRCGYLGWAPATDLSESIRRTLRQFPLERRRLRVVH